MDESVLWYKFVKMKYQYPIILEPSSRATIVMPNKKSGGKIKKQGPSELVFFSRIMRLGFDEIREDICVNIGGHNYEPDFAYINKEKGVYVDIEIDEPYSASGQPTHYIEVSGIPKDAERNSRFQNAGWYVVRLTEEQVFCHTKESLKVILNILKDAGAIDSVPSEYVDVSDLPVIAQWTKEQSYKMYREGFRQTYLHFDPGQMGLLNNLYCIWLIVPILFQSLYNKRVRNKMISQIKGYLIPRKRRNKAKRLRKS